MGAKDVEALGEDIVVDEPSVDGPDAHHEDDVATSKEDLEDLRAVDVLLQLLLLDDHPEGEDEHDGAVAGVAEHDGEQERESGDGVDCRVDLVEKIQVVIIMKA